MSERGLQQVVHRELWGQLRGGSPRRHSPDRTEATEIGTTSHRSAQVMIDTPTGSDTLPRCRLKQWAAWKTGGYP